MPSSETRFYVDETVVHLRGGHQDMYGFLCSMDKVVYLYKPSRETSFLAELLAPFNGFLIS